MKKFLNAKDILSRLLSHDEEFVVSLRYSGRTKWALKYTAVVTDGDGRFFQFDFIRSRSKEYVDPFSGMAVVEAEEVFPYTGQVTLYAPEKVDGQERRDG